MSRRSLFLWPVLVLLSVALVAAPVPKGVTEEGKIGARFGKVASSTMQGEVQRGEFKLSDDTLSLKLGKGVGNPWNPNHSPHTRLPVTGDFRVSVTVRTAGSREWKPAEESMAFAFGLAVWEDDTDEPATVSLSRHFYETSREMYGPVVGWWEKTSASYPLQRAGGGRETEGLVEADPTTPLHLRVTRAGDTFTLAHSRDGKEWEEVDSKAIDFPATVSVGVWAGNQEGGRRELLFENFTLSRSKR